MNNTLIRLVIISFVIAVVLGIYYSVTNQSVIKDELNSTSSNSRGLKGIAKAQQLFSENKGLVNQFRVQLTYNGVLKKVSPGESWSIEKSGKTFTIDQQNNEVEIVYQRSNGGDRAPSQITESDLEIGDRVFINTFVDPTTGNVTVTSITVAPPVSTATPQPTSNPQ